MSMSWCVSRKTISQYLDGELPDRVAQRVREHLAECDRCARAYETLRALEEAIRQDPPAGAARS
jgi:anti-sigma factor RsiW